MTELKEGQDEGKPKKKHLWFGYGSYGSQPDLQIGGGYVRDPNLLEKLSKTPNTERFQFPYFMYIAVGIVVLTLFLMLVAWVFSLFMA